jgi:glycosyltransferase involved in cell wall biosynthesis
MSVNKENILVLFNGPHLAYSPTTIQLYDELSKKYNVTIIAQDPDNYNGQKLNDRNVLYHRYYHVKSRYFYLMLFKLLVLFNKDAKYFRQNGLDYKDYFFRFSFIKKELTRKAYRRIIAIDIKNLFYCSLLKVKADFLSLELCEHEELLPLVDTSLIGCVIIQSPERYQYLFKNRRFTTFYVQNSPNYKELIIDAGRKGLIYAGGAYNVLGFYHCLNYIKKYADEKLTVQGALLNEDKKKVQAEYAALLAEDRLVINSVYLDNDDVVDYISKFEIGFCFYNFDEPSIQRNYFNYVSAPSGKMFKYLAAGVPVVASDILGFRFVKEFQCGILIDSLAEDEIRKAVSAIRDNYDFYVENAVKAARHYSFDKALLPYLHYVEQSFPA